MFRARNLTHKQTIGMFGKRYKENYIVKFGGQKTGYFKMPYYYDSPHYLEKFAYELGKVIGLSCAKIDLAQRYGHEGSVSYNFVRKGEKFISGKTILRFACMKRPELKELKYSIELVIKSIETLNLSTQQKNYILRSFFEMLIFKYSIICGDICSGNWGILRNKKSSVIRFAPIFDNEASFRFNISKKDKILWLRDSFDFKMHLQVTSSGISVNDEIPDTFGILINHIAENYHKETKDLVIKINERLSLKKVNGILKEFGTKFSELDKEYLRTVIIFTRQHLVQLYERNGLNIPKRYLADQSEVLGLKLKTELLKSVASVNKVETLNR